MIKKEKTVIDIIEDASQARAAALEDLRAELKKAEAAAAAAEALAADAIKSGDVDEYTKAKTDSRTAADRSEFFRIQITQTEAAPLFADPAERQAKADAIKSAHEGRKADKLKTAARLLTEAAALVEDVRQDVIASNGALDLLAKNTDTRAVHIDIVIINGLWQRVHGAMEHADIKPYV